MTLSMLIAWVLLAQLVSFWALALMLWLVSEISGVQDVSFPRAAAASMFVLAINFVLIGIAVGAQVGLDWINSPPLAVGLFAGLGLIQLVTPVFLLRYYLQTTFPRSFVLWVAGLVAMSAAGVLMSVGIRARVADAASVENNNMAPELRARYASVVCENCSREFAAGVSANLQAAAEEGNQPALELVCPRCSYANHIAASEPLHAPDWVLIDKAAKPTKDPSWRWKIVAYRPGIEGSKTHVGRVVGLPDESVQISGGDLFVNNLRLQKRGDELPELWWPVYDSSLPRLAQVEDGPGWAPYNAPGWQERDGKWACSAGKVTSELKFKSLITDTPTYDSPRDLPRNFKPLPVRDIQVTITVEQFSGEGLFGFRWDFGDDPDKPLLSCGARFWPKLGEPLDAAPGAKRGIKYQLVTQPLEKRDDDPVGNRQLSGNLPVEFVAPMKFTFGVRDGATYVLHNGQLLAEVQVEPGDVEAAVKRDAAPHTQNLLRLVARDCQISLGPIVVERDVYYRTIPEMGENAGVVTANGNRNPTALSPNEFFILGDNSAHSYDSRFYGPVAAPYMHGAVRSIVWPRDRWRHLP